MSVSLSPEHDLSTCECVCVCAYVLRVWMRIACRGGIQVQHMIGTHVEDVRAQIGVASRFMTPSLPRTTTWAKKQSKILKGQH